MSCPYVCPLCNGKGERELRSDTVYGWSLTAPMMVPCNACGGKGIVWEPRPQDTGYDPWGGAPSSCYDRPVCVEQHWAIPRAVRPLVGYALYLSEHAEESDPHVELRLHER